MRNISPAASWWPRRDAAPRMPKSTSAWTPSRSMSFTRRCGSPGRRIPFLPSAQRPGAAAVPCRHARVRVAGATDPFLAVVVEAGRRHDVDTLVLSRHVLRAGRADAAHEPERGALLGGPLGPAGGLHGVR